MRALIVLLSAIVAAPPADAADPRIRTVVYSPDRVISLVGHFGYLMTIELPAGERIENVAIGDSIAWQVTPNKRGDMLFVKPVDVGQPTNLTVMTAARQYSFELSARARKPQTPLSEITYMLRIQLPEASKAQAPADLSARPSLLNRPIANERYTYSGAPENLPSRVYDDGVSTVFEWPQGAATPAIFVPGPDGKDSVVNYSYAGERIVVHQVAEKFVLRNGKRVTTLYNEGYDAPAPGPDAPEPRGRKKRGLLGRDKD
jgi:type IV secretion system protein VirB9